MNSMDFSIDVTGNVGRDVEQQYTPKGKLVTNTSLACTVGFGDYKRTEWVKLTLWGEKVGELFNNLVKKGTMLRVIGEPKATGWVNKDGEVQTQIEITVQQFRVLKNGRSKQEVEEEDDAYGSAE